MYLTNKVVILKIVLVILKGMIVMIGTINGFKVRRINLRKLKKLSFSASICISNIAEKTDSVLKNGGRLYALINKDNEIAGGYLFELNKNAELDNEKCTALEECEDLFTEETFCAREEFDTALKAELSELTALSTIRYSVFRGEIIKYKDMLAGIEQDSDGEKSLVWIIVLFIVFNKVFGSMLLALIFAYLLSPRKRSETRKELTECEE